jgi:hypothetical protein
MFPEALVVAVVRRPLPNVFSLLKKFTPNPHLRRGPEHGWWGVKPAGWRQLVDTDRVRQVATQWDRVNGKLWAERRMVDRFIAYHDLCADPSSVVNDLAQALGVPAPSKRFAPLSAQDDEYLTGGSLESANRVYGRTKSFDLTEDARAAERLPPLTMEQQRTVIDVCGELAVDLGLQADRPTTPVTRSPPNLGARESGPNR